MEIYVIIITSYNNPTLSSMSNQFLTKCSLTFCYWLEKSSLISVRFPVLNEACQSHRFFEASKKTFLLGISLQYRRTVLQSPLAITTCICFRVRFPCQSVWTRRSCEWIARDVGQTGENLSRCTLHLVTREFGKQNVNTALLSPLTSAPHISNPLSQPFKLLFNFVDCAVNFVSCPVIWTFTRISLFYKLVEMLVLHVQSSDP